MFRLAVISTFLLIGVCSAASYLYHVKVRPETEEQYGVLLRESAELRAKSALENEPAHQSRHRVQKDIWAIKEGQRVHVRLKSAHSELEISQKKEKLEAVERLEELCCWVQDEVDLKENAQQVRMLTADTGTSYFPSYRMGAQNVKIAFFRVPGLEIPSSLEGIEPFLKGSAQTANLMDELSLEGDVRLVSTELQNKKSFAFADRLTYQPETQAIVLSCTEPNRVLFWQEGLSLSSPKLQIKRDPRAGTQQVEGIGDVRCSLSAEEKNFLEELFAKYL